MSKKVLLHEFSSTEFKQRMKEGSLDSVICCFGSCESHGWHLPFNPDYIIPLEIATKAAQRLSKTVVAPAMPYGTSIHYDHFPMSVTLAYDTMIKVAEDIFESLIKHNLKHIYILNGHDGNIPALEIAARNVKSRHPEAVLVYTPAWWEITGEKMQDDFKVWNGLGHGGEGETAITMAVRPDLTHMEHAVCQVPQDTIDLPKGTTVIWDISEVSNAGNTGDATKATMDIGQKMLNIMVDYVVEYIENMEKRNWSYDYKK